MPVVSAGSGKSQHVTQALLDIYTLRHAFAERGGIEGKRILVVGDIARNRAARSLAYTRQQTLWRIILPQCFKRMIPPWMNWYAILTMATPLVSLLGVEEIVTLSRQAMEAEDNHPELLMPFYGFCLVIFFVYCYPIARWTISLERKFMVKL